MSPRDGDQGDAILVVEETPSKLPRIELQALKTVGSSCRLEPEQPGSAWTLWEGSRGAALGSKVTMNNSVKECPAGCALGVTATTPQRTVLPSFHPNNRHICVPDPSLPPQARWLGAHRFVPQDSVSSFTKLADTCPTPSRGGCDEMLLSPPKICIITESTSCVFSAHCLVSLSWLNAASSVPGRRHHTKTTSEK